MGQIPCADCHGGHPADPDWKTAHEGLRKDPTFPYAEAACGECHDEIVSSAPRSLHYTLQPFQRVVEARAGKKDDKDHETLTAAQEKHCRECHASCGQCHVSRPDYVDGGFLNKHNFSKTPPMETTCAACHGGRVYEEYTGLKGKYAADIHYESKKMACTVCHGANQMHADGSKAVNRFDLPERPNCLTCHEAVVEGNANNTAHLIHNDRVACQVCHSQANKNCFSCHVGTDDKQLPYYKCQATKILFKIGRNPEPSPDRPYDYVVVRHAPADPRLFDHYLKGGLANFDSLPTWKMSTPHNIRRITPQNKSCNNCHGNAALFLSEKDMAQWERKANANVVVPAERIPPLIDDDAL
jgi:hypothetical protein